MILSMTGYGRAVAQKDNVSIVCEIKSLNGRATDLRLKSALNLGEKELDIRKWILNEAVRGKIEATISIDGELDDHAQAFNTNLIKSYYTQLKPVMEQLGAPNTDIMASLLRMPNILQNQNAALSDTMIELLDEAVSQSVKKLMAFRANEGESIKADLFLSVSEIEKHLSEIDPFDEDRTDHLKERLRQKMDEFIQSEHVDQSRFEQEVLYYLEKLDINEEKVRLNQHCEHFREVVNADGFEKGKKLAFISQEMGREINTIGAKAQWTPIQKHVVYMKNELEKIKEQLANTL